MPPGFDNVAVIGPDGTAWQTGEVTTSGPTISITVAPLGPAGRYQVGYRVVSGDGHPVQGSTSFVLTKAGTGTPPTQPAATGTPVAGGASGDSSGGGSPVWPWIAAAVVVDRRRGRRGTTSGADIAPTGDLLIRSPYGLSGVVTSSRTGRAGRRPDRPG